MAKYGSPNVVIEFDNVAQALVDMSQYILTIGGIDLEALTEESHGFGDSWREFLATGLRQAAEIAITGFYDDTAATGPDVIFNAVFSSPATATRTLKVTYGGGKSTAIECLIKKYTRSPVRGELTKFEVLLTPTGAPTEV